MKLYRFFALGTILLFALATAAQQSTTPGAAASKSALSNGAAGLPAETQLKILSEKLSVAWQGPGQRLD